MKIFLAALFLLPLALSAQNVGIHTLDPQHPLQVNVDSIFTDTIQDLDIPRSIGFSAGLPITPGAQKGAQSITIGQTGYLAKLTLYFAIPTDVDEMLIEVFRGAGPEGTLMTSATLYDQLIGAATITFPTPWQPVTEGEQINIVMTPNAGAWCTWRSASIEYAGGSAHHFTESWIPLEYDLALTTFVEYTDTIVYPVLSVRDDRKVMINDYALPRYDGTAGDILQTDGSGSVNWLPQNQISSTNSITDADADTKVDVEQMSDEDIIRFKTDGIERMTILQNGKVGVNTMAPASDLDIRGNNDIEDGGEMQLATPSMSNFIRMFGGRLGDPHPFLAFHDTDTFHFVTTLPDWTTFTRRMTIAPDGKIGIGIDKPLSMLDIKSLGNGAELLRFTTDRPWVFKQTGTGINTALTLQPTTNDKAFQVMSENGLNLAARFFANNTYSKVALVPDGGEVGIGMLEATAKLHVRHNSTSSDAHFKLTETSANDYARIKFETESEPGIFWDMAVRSDTSASESRLNFYYSNPGFTGDKMTITGSGNVGIGTSTPSEKLHVVGDMRVSGLAGTGDRNVIVDSNGKFKIGNLGSGDNDWIETPTEVYNNTHNIGIGTSTPASLLHVVGGQVNISTVGTPPFYTDGNTMTLDGNDIDVTGTIFNDLELQRNADGDINMVRGGGNVGIGQIAANNKKLSINGVAVAQNNSATLSLISSLSGSFHEMLLDGRTIHTVDDDLKINFASVHDVILTSNSQNSNRVGIGTGAPTSKLTVRGPQSDGTNGILRLINETNSNFMVLDDNELDVSGETFFINKNSTQNVAIGTTAPALGYKLSVGGKIIAEEVRVQLQSAWPDYVFKEDYPLMPLEEVKQVIQTKGHLPGIPSASQVEEEGILIGDMQRMMMEKIEELTLHIISLNERLEKVEKENVALKTIKNP